MVFVLNKEIDILNNTGCHRIKFKKKKATHNNIFFCFNFAVQILIMENIVVMTKKREYIFLWHFVCWWMNSIIILVLLFLGKETI